MRLGNARGGAGALFTTAADLVIWSDALGSGRLGKFVTAKIQEPATLSNGRKLTYARGLSLLTENSIRILIHSGGAAAYRSIAAHFVDQNISVAVLCNAGEAADARDDFAGYIFDMLTGKGLMRPPSTPPPAGITGVDVSGRAGRDADADGGRNQDKLPWNDRECDVQASKSSSPSAAETIIGKR